MQITTSEALRQEIDALIRAHPIFASLRDRLGCPPIRQGQPGFEGFADIIVSQQISKAAANSILTRLRQAVGTDDPATAFLALDDGQKRSIGLSRPKGRYLEGIARAFIDGTLVPENLAELDDHALMSTLTGLPGIGRWSAEIYALFVLGRPDIFPAGDLALQESFSVLTQRDARIDEKALRDLSAAYSPHRSAAARLLWHGYRSGMPI